MGWSQGSDVGSDAAITSSLNLTCLDRENGVAKAIHEKMKKSLPPVTKSAIADGVFGAPTVLIDDKLCGGNISARQPEVIPAPHYFFNVRRVATQGSSAWRNGSKNT